MRRWIVRALMFGLLSAAPSATVVVPAEFKEIVGDADLIVRGRVTDVRGVVTPDRGVESVATVAIEATLKGTPAEFISLMVPGGTIGRYSTRMVGAPTLRAGESALLFLKRDGRNAWRPVGLSMGVIPIHADAQTGAPVVTPPVVSGYTADVGRVVRGDARRKPMPASSFESLVRVVIAAQTGGGAASR